VDSRDPAPHRKGFSPRETASPGRGLPCSWSGVGCLCWGRPYTFLRLEGASWRRAASLYPVCQLPFGLGTPEARCSRLSVHCLSRPVLMITERPVEFYLQVLRPHNTANVKKHCPTIIIIVVVTVVIIIRDRILLCCPSLVSNSWAQGIKSRTFCLQVPPAPFIFPLKKEREATHRPSPNKDPTVGVEH
jgi:hypothetical protein